MNTLTIFATQISISLFISGLSLWILSRPLINVLDDLCATKRQAKFWQTYTRLMLSISPLLLVLVVSGLVHSSNIVTHMKVSLVAGLAGLLIGLLIVGRCIFMPASRQCDAVSVSSPDMPENAQESI